jgi:hypothetical protein
MEPEPKPEPETELVKSRNPPGTEKNSYGSETLSKYTELDHQSLIGILSHIKPHIGTCQLEPATACIMLLAL